jgi:four helix bundle protein
MKTEAIQSNLVLKLTFEFSLAIIEYCEKLEQEKKFVLSRQLLRSGTSIGANCIEAQNSESKADFIHKFKIAAKETEETKYWLMLCDQSKNYPDCKMLLAKIEEIDKVISRIISSSKKNFVHS